MIDPEFDSEAIDMLNRVGRPGFARKMTSMFERSAPEKVATIKVAFAGCDTNAIAQAAHSLKSSAGQLGAISLQTLAGQIESAAEAGDMGSLDLLVKSVESELTAALNWLSSVTSPDQPALQNPGKKP